MKIYRQAGGSRGKTTEFSVFFLVNTGCFDRLKSEKKPAAPFISRLLRLLYNLKLFLISGWIQNNK
jgi:hypothetical protein